MKEIKAVVLPARLARIREALRNLPGFPGMTVTRVEGCSAPGWGTEQGIKGELTDFSPHTRIDILAPDGLVAPIVDLIRQHGHTGHKGDGLVWVTPVETSARIRDELPRPH